MEIQEFGCKYSYTCDTCGTEYVCDGTGKYEKGEPVGNVVYIDGPCCCIRANKNMCGCKPESSLSYDTMLQNINISIKDFGVPELGKVGPYFKYVKFPIETSEEPEYQI